MARWCIEYDVASDIMEIEVRKYQFFGMSMTGITVRPRLVDSLNGGSIRAIEKPLKKLSRFLFFFLSHNF